MRCNGLPGGTKWHYSPGSKAYGRVGYPGICSIAQSTISVCSILMLRDLENRCSEIESEAISQSNIYIVCKL